MLEIQTGQYGDEDSSYQAMGGEDGIRRLVDSFYEAMATRPDARHIFEMHPNKIEISRAKLTAFLCGWLGGPRRYNERYGSIALPRFHQKFPIGPAERDAWLHCMKIAVDEQDWRDDFKAYLMVQFAIPAERCRSF